MENENGKKLNVDRGSDINQRGEGLANLDMRTRNVAIMPLRSGSKRVPHKNIMDVAGKPLFYYQLMNAKKSQNIDKIIVATESEQYARKVEEYGVEVIIRPADIAKDDSRVEETLLFVLEELKMKGEEYTNVVLLQATSPLNDSINIDNALRLMETGKYKSVLTYIEFKGFFLDDEDILQRPNSQDKKKRKLERGSLWVTDVASFLEKKNRIVQPCAHLKIPEITSFEIDTFEDKFIVEALLEKKRILYSQMSKNTPSTSINFGDVE